MDITRGEVVDADLDRFIHQRHARRVKDEGPRPSEELYMDFVRRYEERQLRERLWERLRHHEQMVRSGSPAGGG